MAPSIKFERNQCIMRAVLLGSRMSAIAKWFGLSRQAISEIVHRECRYANLEVYRSICFGLDESGKPFPPHLFKLREKARCFLGPDFAASLLLESV